MDHVEPPQDDFRSRLARIPRASENEDIDNWSDAAPPVVRRPAPVARPATQASPAQVPQHEPAPHIDPQTTQPQPAQPPGLPPEDEFFDDSSGRRRRRWPIVLLGIVVLLLLTVLLSLWQAQRLFNGIERAEVSEVLTPPPTGTNILLVGTDSREGIDADTENAGLILGEGIGGSRTDTIMVLRLEDDGAKFLSLPRDLWLPINGGSSGRINTAFGQGPESLINTVQDGLGIPLSHYLQVDLAGFIDLVDAVGGVDITIPYPASDRNSGLNLPTAGTVTLDSTQALAYVRSRYYVELRDGVAVADPTSDLGRVQRQQEFMRALMQKVTTQRNPLALNDMASSISDAIVMDDGTSISDALQILNSLRGEAPESVVLPTTGSQQGAASVLVLAGGSDEVLAQFAG